MPAAFPLANLPVSRTKSSVSWCVQLDAAPGKPGSSCYPMLHCGGAGLLLPLLVLEKALCTPWQMGGSDARVSRRFNPAGPCVGRRLPSPHCTLAMCLVKLCFARGLQLICMKGNGASFFTFHLPMSSCDCSLIPVELQPLGRDLASVWLGCSCCSRTS